MILIFTNKEDIHPSPVIDILTERGAPFFRFNTEALLVDYELDWYFENGKSDFRIRDKENGKVCIGSEISAVWDRRPTAPEMLPMHNTEEIDKFRLKEALGFLRFLRYYIEDIPSIGSISGDRVASSKMLQYRTAADVGFSVPRTIFSNRKDSISAFFSGKNPLSVKPIDSSYVWDEYKNLDYVFYTQILNVSDIPSIPEEAFSQTVNFVQEYVPKDYEVRVTVVGDDVFATRIDSQKMSENEGSVDWRQGYNHGIKWEAIVLPEVIASRCRNLVHVLGLNFGCIDLIVRPDGEYVFLECNPNGQWLWIELETGQKISESIATFLIDTDSYHI